MLDVKMKLALFCSVLFLAGAVSSSSVNVDTNSVKAWAAEAKLDIPDWVIDLIGRLPESIQEIIDRIPEIIAAIPGILQQIPAIIAAIIQKIPEIIPIIVDKIPEIIAQIPAAIDIIKEVLLLIIEKLPEVIPIILEKIKEIIALLPEVIDRIKEILENLDLPDWFPTLPDLDKPDWWPDELPTLPEYNKPEAGSLTSVNQYPSIVQIEVGTGPIWAQGCVGTVLTNFHILSGARCFSGLLYNDRFRRVRAGASRRYEGGSIAQVASSVVHPDFNNDQAADVAVIRLATNLILGNTIQQGSIVSQGFVMPDNFIVSVAGWGSTAQGGLISNRDLYEKDLVSIPQSTCAERWGIVPKFSLPENAVCVGQISTGGRNGDIRDSGAPVFYQGIQVGIISAGVPVGNQHFPVVATPVGAYTNWIVSNAV